MEKMGYPCQYDDLNTKTRECMDTFFWDALNEFQKSDFYSKDG